MISVSPSTVYWIHVNALITQIWPLTWIHTLQKWYGANLRIWRSRGKSHGRRFENMVISRQQATRQHWKTSFSKMPCDKHTHTPPATVLTSKQRGQKRLTKIEAQEGHKHAAPHILYHSVAAGSRKGVCQTAVPVVATGGQYTHWDVTDAQQAPLCAGTVLQDPVIPDLGLTAALCSQLCKEYHTDYMWHVLTTRASFQSMTPVIKKQPATWSHRDLQ